MAFSYYAELYFAGLGWVDITDDVYGHDRSRVEITHGASGEDGTYRPSGCTFQLNLRGGKYAPMNAEGNYYGLLDLNTPLQIYKKQITAGFASTVSNAWPNTDTGEVWTSFGAGGVLSSSDYNSSGGLGTMSVPAANAYRSMYLAATSYKTFDVMVDLKLDTTNITGAQVSWGVLLSGVTTSYYWRAEVAVQVDESIKLGLVDPNGNYTQTPVTVAGVTHVNTNIYRLRMQYEGWTCRMKLWLASGVEPYDWHATIHNTFPIAMGWTGAQSKRDTGNTNGTLVFSYDNWVLRDMRFAGEVSEWPPKWDTSGKDIYTPITAASITRRVSAGNAPLLSPPRAYIPDFAAANGVTVCAYWPLEDGGLALTGKAVIGAYDLVPVINEKPLSQHFGKGTLDGWLYPVWAQWNDGSFGSGGGGVHSYVAMPTFSGANGWRTDFVVRMNGSADWSVTVNTGVTFWQAIFRVSTKFVDYTLPTGATGSVDLSGMFDGSTHLFTIRAHQSGGNIVWCLDVDNVQRLTTTFAATLAKITGLGSGAPSSTPATSAHALGHIIVFDKDFVGTAGTEVYDAVVGFPNELTSVRAARLCAIADVPFYYDGRSGEAANLSTQSLSPLSSQLDDIAKVDGGLLSDSRHTVGLRYRQLSDMTSRTATVTLDYAAGELVPPLDIAYDDRYTVNDLVVSSDGSQAQATWSSGPMSTAKPSAGGIGRYNRQITVNGVQNQLADIAGWKLGLGTVKQVRLRSATVNLSRPRLAGKVNSLLQVEIGDRIDIVNNKKLIGQTVQQLVVGYTEVINGFVQTLTFVTAPYAPYQVTVLDSATYRLAAGSSFLNTTVNTTATSWSVKSLDGSLWTTAAGDFPFNVVCGGEEVTVTNITGASSPQTFTVTRSVNGVVKSHTADDSELARVQVAQPTRLALWRRD